MGGKRNGESISMNIRIIFHHGSPTLLGNVLALRGEIVIVDRIDVYVCLPFCVISNS